MYSVAHSAQTSATGLNIDAESLSSSDPFALAYPVPMITSPLASRNDATPEGASLQSILFGQTAQLPRARPRTWSARGPPGKEKCRALDQSNLSGHRPACSGKASDNLSPSRSLEYATLHSELIL